VEIKLFLVLGPPLPPPGRDSGRVPFALALRAGIWASLVHHTRGHCSHGSWTAAQKHPGLLSESPCNFARPAPCTEDSSRQVGRGKGDVLWTRSFETIRCIL